MGWCGMDSSIWHDTLVYRIIFGVYTILYLVIKLMNILINYTLSYQVSTEGGRKKNAFLSFFIIKGRGGARLWIRIEGRESN